ncbi:hypothetical protein FKZ61_022470 [Litorilinea aerophila]|uniref:hypothetical protein n=1 Tax=Litorilinea aerophila TaxID=1204385 RepID=UPI001E3394EE|nr:hypothetical protein [Litorilinea aerophila]MCC9078863.1 hypothetical protein [Litorilinea aerophila]
MVDGEKSVIQTEGKMVVEPAQPARERRERLGQDQPVYEKPAHGNGAHWEESPELLRWRADLLLDEMMLGGVDVSAADLDPAPATPETTAAPDHGVYPDNGLSPENGLAKNGPGNGAAASAAAARQADLPAGEPPRQPGQPREEARPAGVNGAHPSDAPTSTPVSSANLSSVDASATPSTREEPASPSIWDDRPWAREGSWTGVEESSSPEAEPGKPTAPEHPATRPTTTQPDDQNAGGNPWLLAAEQRYAPYTGPRRGEGRLDRADGSAPGRAEAGLSSSGRRSAGTGETAQTSETSEAERPLYAHAMSFRPGGKNRSGLLPRMTSLDLEAVQQEITALHNELVAILPIGNETAQRGLHLLDKAQDLLDRDPSRSAEVEYYMQQVRSIAQRVRQTRRWSELYRQRLRTYLLAWAALAGLLLVARFLYQGALEAFVAELGQLLPDSLFLRHSAALWGTLLAGGLGGAIGALQTMRYHARLEYGFFDRKYGLRGLILPFISLIVGGFIYGLIALVYLFLGVDPSRQWLAAIFPGLLAFLFGLMQESIYGTRG